MLRQVVLCDSPPRQGSQQQLRAWQDNQSSHSKMARQDGNHGCSSTFICRSRPARAPHRECFAMTKEKRMKSGRAIRVNGGRSDDKKMQDFDSVFIASPTNRACFQAEHQLDHCLTWLVHSTSVGRQDCSSLKAGRYFQHFFTISVFNVNN